MTSQRILRWAVAKLFFYFIGHKYDQRCSWSTYTWIQTGLSTTNLQESTKHAHRLAHTHSALPTTSPHWHDLWSSNWQGEEWTGQLHTSNYILGRYSMMNREISYLTCVNSIQSRNTLLIPLGKWNCCSNCHDLSLFNDSYRKLQLWAGRISGSTLCGSGAEEASDWRYSCWITVLWGACSELSMMYPLLHNQPQRLQNSLHDRASLFNSLSSLFESLALMLLPQQMTAVRIALSTWDLQKICNIFLQTLKDLSFLKK